MLETIDLSREDMGKSEYKAVHDELMDRLVVLQQQARSRGIGLVVLFEIGGMVYDPTRMGTDKL